VHFPCEKEQRFTYKHKTSSCEKTLGLNPQDPKVFSFFLPNLIPITTILDVKVIVVLYLFTLLDIIFSGSITAVLQKDGWTRKDQIFMRIYQGITFVFAVSIITLMYFVGILTLWQVAKLAILFIAFIEDFLYYIMSFLYAPVQILLAGAAEKVKIDGEHVPIPPFYIPERISGWYAFIFGKSIETKNAFVITKFAMLIYVIVCIEEVFS